MASVVAIDGSIPCAACLNPYFDIPLVIAGLVIVGSLCLLAIGGLL